ncbi:MAG: class I SAM-dependent methyltransferase [Bacteroidia bacterium]
MSLVTNKNSKQEWFKLWFNSPYYHILYRHRNEAEAARFLDNLINHFKPAPGSSILDLGCGRGRHSVYLNERGFDVTGVDISEENIAFNKQYENEHLKFFVHDMREVFQPESFSFIFNLFTSFGYFENDEDNQKTVNAAAKDLKEDGIFLIDYLNVNKVLNELEREEIKIVDEIEFHIRRGFDGKFITKNITFEDFEDEFNYQEKVRALPLPDFEEYFKKAGLKIVHLSGNYNLQPYDAENSPRLIIAGTK